MPQDIKNGFWVLAVRPIEGAEDQSNTYIMRIHSGFGHMRVMFGLVEQCQYITGYTKIENAERDRALAEKDLGSPVHIIRMVEE